MNMFFHQGQMDAEDKVLGAVTQCNFESNFFFQRKSYCGS
jgi:hypothetical protein